MSPKVLQAFLRFNFPLFDIEIIATASKKFTGMIKSDGSNAVGMLLRMMQDVNFN